MRCNESSSQNNSLKNRVSHRPLMNTKKKPLAGIRILAIEQYGAGPFGSMYLADLGAEVIKIENPLAGGDIARQSGPYFMGDNDSTFFQTFNLNKKSFTLNLKHEKGQEILHELVKSADAVVNNLRGDQPEKLGITYEQLKVVKPEICCAHLSAYGRDNDRVDWPGYDYLMQAEAGFMDLTGEPDGPPTRFGLSMVDYMTGVTLALGLTAALFSAQRNGVGRDVDVSLFDVALHQLTYPATWQLNHSHETTRGGRSAHPMTVPCQLYRAQDSWLFVMAMTDKFWQILVKELGSSQLQSEEFSTAKARNQRKAEINQLIESCLMTQPTQHWLRVFEGQLPVSAVNNLQQALTNPFVADVGMMQTTQHANGDTLNVMSNPIKLDGDRIKAKVCQKLGESTNEIMTSLGYSNDAIKQLKLEHCI